MIFVNNYYDVKSPRGQRSYKSRFTGAVYTLLINRIVTHIPLSPSGATAFSPEHSPNIVVNGDVHHLLHTLVNNIKTKEFLSADITGKFAMLNLVTEPVGVDVNPDKILIQEIKLKTPLYEIYNQYLVNNF